MATDNISALIKFCSADTGQKILNSQTLRWSAPHLFNDPFELDHNSIPDFSSEDLLKGMIKAAITMLFGPNEPTGKNNRLVAAISRWRDEERFASEDEAEQVLNQLLSQVAQQQQESIQNYLAKWKNYAQKLRICSFVDKATNMHAWKQFADNHAGIALKFSAGDHTALTHPVRVNYSQTPPNVTSLAEQVAVSYGKAAQPSSENFQQKFLVKNKEFNFEREWRCFEHEADTKESDPQLWYINKAFSAPELKAVYLGLKTSQNNRDAIIKIVKEKYKNTRVYQATSITGKYEVDFLQVNTK